MNKIVLFLFLSAFAFGRFEAKPVEACEAFNNMKHTKNTHNVHLDTSIKYRILSSKKGQKLVLVKGVQPAQRWVDGSCFFKNRTNLKQPSLAQKRTLEMKSELKKASINMSQNRVTKKASQKSTSRQNLLALSWQNAFCESHRYKKECKTSFLNLVKKPYGHTRFVLHGLWPQPRNNQYCGVPNKVTAMDKHKQWHTLPPMGLTSTTKTALKEVMPGFTSNLHKHEWIKHGTCYGTDANSYYLDAVSLVKQFNDSTVGKYFSRNIGRVVKLKDVRKMFESSFGRGTGDKVEFKCKNGLIGELWLHLGSGEANLATLLKSGKRTRSRCQSGRIDRAGFGR